MNLIQCEIKNIEHNGAKLSNPIVNIEKLQTIHAGQRFISNNGTDRTGIPILIFKFKDHNVVWFYPSVVMRDRVFDSLGALVSVL